MTKFCSSSSSGVQCGREAFACGAPSSKRLELKRNHGNICDICGICLLFHTRQDFRKLDEALPLLSRLGKGAKDVEGLDRFGTSGMIARTFQHIQSDSNHLLFGINQLNPDSSNSLQVLSFFVSHQPWGSLAGSTQRMLPTMSRVVAPAKLEHTICHGHTANSLDSENQRILLTGAQDTESISFRG